MPDVERAIRVNERRRGDRYARHVGQDRRVDVQVQLSAEDAEWLCAQAAKRGQSLSSLVAEAPAAAGLVGWVALCVTVGHVEEDPSGKETMMAPAESTYGLIARYLEPDPERPGPADWRIKGHRLPVWRIIRQFALEKGMDNPEGYWDLVLHLELDDPLIKELAGYYELPSDAIEAAVAYSHDHADALAARLRLALAVDVS